MLHSKRKSKLFFLAWGALIALFLVIFSKGFLFLARPLLFVKQKIEMVVERTLLPFGEKSVLLEENSRLRQKLVRLEIKNDYCAAVAAENEELRSVFGRKKENENLLAASVLARPGYGIYNGLILNAGSREGVEQGMRVTAFNEVLLGYVSEVLSDVSTVKLVSYPKEETNVFVGGSVAAIAVGRGGENMEIELPKDVVIRVGDEVVSLGMDYLLLGIVEIIERSEVNPFQKIFFRLSANVQELRYVYLSR